MSSPAGDLRAYPRHLRACNICMNRARLFAMNNGITWSRFVDEGVSVSTLRATGDHFACVVADCAEQEASGG